MNPLFPRIVSLNIHNFFANVSSSSHIINKIIIKKTTAKDTDDILQEFFSRYATYLEEVLKNVIFMMIDINQIQYQ